MRKPSAKLRAFCAPKKFQKNETVMMPLAEMALIEVEAASICDTDLRILDGVHDAVQGVVLGHEYIGKIVKIGKAVRHCAAGDRVAVDPNMNCGLCVYCRNAKPNLCQNTTTLGIFADGGFAPLNLVPAKQLYKIPENLPAKIAVLVEPLSCVMHGLRQIDGVNPAERVLIFGAGSIGCYFAIMARLAGAREIVVVEPSTYRYVFVRRLGFDALQADAILAIKSLQQNTFDVVIDASGASSVVGSAIALARPGAKVLLFGQQDTSSWVCISATSANQKELRIVGSYAAAYNFEKTAQLLALHQKAFGDIITFSVALNEIEDAFERIRQGNVMKILVYPQEAK